MDKEILEILIRLESKVDSIETKVDKLETKVGKLETKVDKLEIKLDEHTQILRALEHSSEVNKADHDKMTNDIARLKAVK